MNRNGLIRDRYRARFLTLGPKHSLTFPARKAYTVENLLYSTAERMRNRIHPALYMALNARSRETQRIIDLMRVGS